MGGPLDRDNFRRRCSTRRWTLKGVPGYAGS